MKISNLPAKKAMLAEVQEQFETWRKNRGKKKAIPEALWTAANLAEKHQKHIFPGPIIFSSFLFFLSL
jgi:hypothetical protein